MSAKNLLDHLFQSGKNLLQQGRQMAETGLNVPASGPERDASLSNLKKGALVGGVLALLLGTKTGRRVGKSGLKLGALAALGTLGYQAYQKWQAQRSGAAIGGNAASPRLDSPPQSAAAAIAAPATATALATGIPTAEHVPGQMVPGGFTHELQGVDADRRSQLLLRAMVGAAKADGHIDDQERQRIVGQIKELNLDPETEQLLQMEVNRAVDVAALAREVNSLPARIETYLASAFVIDIDNPEERDYLNRLAEALGLDRELAKSIEAELND